MSAIAQKSLVTAGLAALMGCSSYIVVEVRADCAGVPCTVPEQVDAISLLAWEAPPSDPAADPLREVGRQDFTLDSNSKFPVEVLLEPGSNTPERLWLEVSLGQNDTLVGEQTVLFAWDRGAVNITEVTVLAIVPP